MKKFRWLLLAFVALGLMATAGCGSSSGDSTEKDPTTTAADAGSDDGGAAADDGFLTGTSEEWLAEVCGADAEVSDGGSDLEPRYGPDATSSMYCTPPAQADGSDTYPEAVLFSSDPSADWKPSTEADTYLTFAIGQVSDDEWALVYEDSSTDEIAEPHLAGLTEFGFTVYENNEPVS